MYHCQTTDNNNIENETTAYQATTEEYEQTYKEVAFFIKRIQSTIIKKDYNEWKNICTDEYIKYFSSKTVLDELSETPQLKARGVKLTNLKDFFTIVFIPSRNNKKMDKIEFVTKSRVQAFSITDFDTYVLLYLLEKDKNNEWKIGLW